MKRYHVFAYPAYYPGGGWSDHRGSFDDLREAYRCADGAKNSSGGIEIIDMETEQDVYTYISNRPYGSWCMDPVLCYGRGFCPRNPTCGD